MDNNDIVSRIIKNITDKQRNDRPLLIAIDGRCTAGKTTLASDIQAQCECNVFHMDDFFLRPEQRKSERYEEPGGNVDHERFLEEVILPIREQRAFSYRPFSCKQQSLIEPVSITPCKLNIIEGSYSCHPQLWDYYDLHVFLTITPEEQIERITKRNGAEALQQFINKWIPLEEKYFDAYRVKKRCEIQF